MPVITFSKEDIQSSHLVENPDWYPYKIVKVSPKPAKTDGSTNYWVTFRGMDPGEMSGVLVTEMWNVKAAWSMVSLFRATHQGQDPKEGDNFKFEELVDVQLQAYTVRGDKFGTISNVLKDYRPL